jgi:accessory gene regulator protein AgrB
MNGYYKNIIVSYYKTIIKFIKRGRWIIRMEKIANQIIKYLDDDRTSWDDLDRMRMNLGIQVLMHNIIMIGTILLIAHISRILWEAMFLLFLYGTLKMCAGGIHFKRSSFCLIGTGIFVEGGVFISKQLNTPLSCIIIIYLICLGVLAIIGPQGTENNPISPLLYEKLKKRTIFLVLIYMLGTIIIAVSMDIILYIPFIAVVFETLSLLPLHIKSRIV